MNLQKVILTKNDCYKQGKQIQLKGIMIHSTGVNNPNINRYVPIGSNYSSMNWNKPGITKCVHAFVGKLPDGGIGTVQTLPFNIKGWHSGSGSKGKKSANNTHIGFECCEDDLKDERYFKQVYKEACEFIAYLCDKFALDPMKPGVVISHHEGNLLGIASNHGDIDHWLKVYGLTMDDLRKNVKAIMEANKIVDYLEFENHMNTYLSKLRSLPCSSWAENENENLPDDIKRVMESVSDRSTPQMFCTREQCLAMIQRALLVSKEEK